MWGRLRGGKTNFLYKKKRALLFCKSVALVVISECIYVALNVTVKQLS
jgi:hypothetical protein